MLSTEEFNFVPNALADAPPETKGIPKNDVDDGRGDDRCPRLIFLGLLAPKDEADAFRRSRVKADVNRKFILLR